MIGIALILIIAAAVLVIIRLYRGPTRADRIIAADQMAILLAALLMLEKMQTGWNWNVDAVWILLAISFLGTVTASIWVEEEKNG